ncbi:MAG: DUF262 domain-containing protein [Promethearchaeota archaeon]
MKTKIEKLEEKTFEENDSPELPPPDIVAYNELRSCADLVRMYKQKILEIQPEFQRGIVWGSSDQTRFIDSLVKQLPIPSMCFSLDYKTQSWQVIDGLQRIWSIIRFLTEKTWTLSNLEDIDPKLSGQSVKNLIRKSSKQHYFYTRVENLTLPITVLRCDYTKESHTHYLFTIFHRLNTGGMKLNNQEIRNCIYSGEFNDLLKELDKDTQWREINRMKPGKTYRLTKQELILRLFAFHDNYMQYAGRLARFLNDYMSNNKHMNNSQIMKKKRLFKRTVDIIYNKIFDGKTAPKTSIALLEALLVGVSFNLKSLKKKSPAKIKTLYRRLQKHSEFSEQKLSEGLAGKPRVIGRMKAAKLIFGRS